MKINISLSAKTLNVNAAKEVLKQLFPKQRIQVVENEYAWVSVKFSLARAMNFLESKNWIRDTAAYQIKFTSSKHPGVRIELNLDEDRTDDYVLFAVYTN